MDEKNGFEKIKISMNIKDSTKRSLTENYIWPQIKFKMKNEEEEENNIDQDEDIINTNKNNRAYSLNISMDDPITKEDLDSIKNFKEYCLSINFRYDSNIFSDLLLLRFLKNNNFNVKNTHKKLLNYIKFYTEYKIYDIKITEFPNIDKIKLFYPHGFHKTSILGEPIFIQMLGQLKINDINRLLKEPLLTKYIVYRLNELEKDIFPKCTLFYKRKIDKIFCIIDLMGLTTSLMSKDIYNFIKKQIDIVTNYFPGILGSLYFINTGLVFRGIWSTCKYLYDSRTRNRIKLLGFQYKDELLTKIKEKNLPKFFGGLCNCEPYGCLFSNEGPWNENKIVKEGDKRRGINYLEIVNKKKKDVEDKDDLEIEEEEDDKKDIEEDLNDNIINQNYNIDDLKGPNDISDST